MTGTRDRLIDALPGCAVSVAAVLFATQAVQDLRSYRPILFVIGLATPVLVSVLYRGGTMPLARLSPVPTLPPPSSTRPERPATEPALALLPEPPAPGAARGPQSDDDVTTPRRASVDAFQARSFSVGVQLTHPKPGSAESENEDSFRLDARAGRLVVSDGAGSSFAARDWSQAICNVLSESPFPTDHGQVAERLTIAAGRWNELQQTALRPDGAETQWWAQEGLRRGAFATVLDIEVGEYTERATGQRRRGWRAFAVGDSCVLQLRNESEHWRIVQSFPLTTSGEFDSNPELVSSNKPTVAVGRWSSGEAQPGDVLIGATDAVSQWLMTPGTDLGLCLSLDEKDLTDLFTVLRTSQKMVKDDVTFVRLGFS
jgi:hypothetical protein